MRDMSQHPSALLVLLSHVVAWCQALHLEAPVRGGGEKGGSAGRLPGRPKYDEFDTKDGCLVWSMSGRLGNQFSGLGDALFMAEMCGLRCVHVSEEQRHSFGNLLDLPEDLPMDNPYSHDNTSAMSMCERAKDHFHWSHGYWANPPPMDLTKMIFHKRLWPKMKRHVIDGLYRDDTLVVHLRGGDILSARENHDYMPAPCAFYAHIMKYGWQGKAFKDVIAISDTVGHPCLHTLGLHLDPGQRLFRIVADEEAGHRTGPPFSFHRQSQDHTATITKATVEDDFMLLASAKNVAMSTSSTFGMHGVMMNPHDVNVFMPTYSGVYMCCDGNSNMSRLHELCQIGGFSNIYEIPFPTGYDKVFSDRSEWLRTDFPINASTVIHCCNELSR